MDEIKNMSPQQEIKNDNCLQNYTVVTDVASLDKYTNENPDL